MGALVLADYDGIPHHDHRVQLHDVPWEDYERLLEIDLRELESFIDYPTTSRAMREYRDAIRG